MATAPKKEFKLDGSLEQLVSLANNASIINERARVKVDDSLIQGAENVNSALRSLGISNTRRGVLGAAAPYEFRQLVDHAEGKVYERLEGIIDDAAYKEARTAYLGSLDENHKTAFYTEMLRKDMIPKAPDDKAKDKDKEAYKVLMAAKAELDVADAIDAAVNSDDLDQAGKIVERFLDVKDLNVLGIYSAHGGRAFQGSEKDTYKDVANARRDIAAKLIQGNKLYSLIDQGIQENKQGKAYSLVGMYNVYNKQVRDNKDKEEAEKKAKGGK